MQFNYSDIASHRGLPGFPSLFLGAVIGDVVIRGLNKYGGFGIREKFFTDVFYGFFGVIMLLLGISSMGLAYWQFFVWPHASLFHCGLNLFIANLRGITLHVIPIAFS